MAVESPCRGYVICSEHRSGSTFLCELLTSAGLLGRPDEFFRSPEFCVRVEQDPDLLANILRQATTPNGVYGLKVFSNQFDMTMKARWVSRLPNLHFIHLERRDLLGQAISYVKAIQTKRYWSEHAPCGEPRYDRRAIARHLARIADGQARWRRYFARNGIRPLWLIHEDIVADPQGAVDAVAAHLGVGEPTDIDHSFVRAGIMADAVSDQWRSRFVAEAADLDYLDVGFGKSRLWLRRRARDAWYLGHILKPT